MHNFSSMVDCDVGGGDPMANGMHPGQVTAMPQPAIVHEKHIEMGVARC